MMRPVHITVSLVLIYFELAAAHSWLEQLSNIASNGSFVAGYGYPRGFVDKGAPSFDQNANVRRQELDGQPEKGGTVFVFGTQRPRQDEILLDVLEWTRDGLGGDRRGFLLPSQNFDDGRCYQLGNGAALATSRKEQTPNALPGQLGSEHELLCETDVRVPDDIQVGKPYTMYWVWQWPNAPGKDPNYPRGKDEYYASCLDVDIDRALSLEQEQLEHPII
ncbi:hypothetical protein PMIN04_007912 [Paraphaeosphaeria minitans]|uniref:DUF7492 domain-containing protein n=1 Tax=Paraphaeosphaeria minitans TaxID=565426 RepID=A0A9P6KKT9_9PLEO|nr:hypothetical protein PMIN01_11701 [Paraphaeosphaeria minitans]KAF9730135.1 hypothetical protein PMIN01_12068 [Paraphaeosphaeria minitans]